MIARHKISSGRCTLWKRAAGGRLDGHSFVKTDPSVPIYL